MHTHTHNAFIQLESPHSTQIHIIHTVQMCCHSSLPFILMVYSKTTSLFHHFQCSVSITMPIEAMLEDRNLPAFCSKCSLVYTLIARRPYKLSMCHYMFGSQQDTLTLAMCFCFSQQLILCKSAVHSMLLLVL